MAAGEVIPKECAEELHVCEGGRRWGAISSEGGPGDVWRVSAAADRAQRDVFLFYHS